MEIDPGRKANKTAKAPSQLKRRQEGTGWEEKKKKNGRVRGENALTQTWALENAE